MSAPSPMLSKLAVPHSHYPGLALTQKDFRLNFCINCGTQSSPAVVPIYRVQTLDAQMDEVSMTGMTLKILLVYLILFFFFLLTLTGIPLLFLFAL